MSFLSKWRQIDNNVSVPFARISTFYKDFISKKWELGTKKYGIEVYINIHYFVFVMINYNLE